MNRVDPQNARLRFGDFEYDPERRELRKHGIRVRLQPQALAVLLALLESPGKVVGREDLHARLWGSDTFVEFEGGLNSAIRRLRDVLCDSADKARYIETVPAEGYRFIAPVERFQAPAIAPVPEQPVTPSGFMGVRWPDQRPWLWAGGVVLLAGIALTFVGFRHFSPRISPKSNFQARDWALITDFENRTGEAVLDGTLEYALERELSNSQFVNVVPHERVDDTLRLMRKPLDTKIDAALGREICLRDGGIRVLVTGRAEKLGTTYVLSANLIEPARGVTLASISEEDPAESRLALTVRRLSDRVREALGEERELIQQSDDRLEKVTTPSLHALQLYTHANDLMRRYGSQDVPGALLEQAVAEDPEFASAHLLLAWTYQNRDQEAKARSEFHRALDLANSASERERLFIVGSYYEAVERDPSKAIEAYESLVRLYPDHFWAANNLPLMYALVGRWDDSWHLSIRLADLRPDDLGKNFEAACLKCLQKDTRAAQRYIDRVKAIEKADPPMSLQPFLIFQNWVDGDLAKAHAQLEEYADHGKGPPPDPIGVSFQYLAFGEFREAERAARWELDVEARNAALGIIKFAEGDLQAARENFATVKGHLYDINGLTLVVMGRCGLWKAVDTFILGNPKDSPSVKIMRGERALARGQTKEGIALLEEGRQGMRMAPTGPFFLGFESLAQAYQKQGDRESALRVLQEAHDAKARAYSCLTGPPGPMLGALWLRTELQLTNLYRKMGRVPEAEKVEAELRNMLAYADWDHPILMTLQKRAQPDDVGTYK